MESEYPYIKLAVLFKKHFGKDTFVEITHPNMQVFFDDIKTLLQAERIVISIPPEEPNTLKISFGYV